ncbi:MAG: hypothetical protein JNL98_04935 [Bryobacterales bacterium]|nr:hypothetical protein [Bryobacterales bacterium]
MSASSAVQPARTPSLQIGSPYPDFLVSLDLPVSLPLPVWAAHLDRTLDQHQHAADTPECQLRRHAAIAGCYNQAGLVETHFGRLPIAGTLCEAALHWHSHQLRGAGASLARFAFQPYVNQSRLERIFSHFDTAIAMMEALSRALDGQQDAHFGPLTVTHTHWLAIAAEHPQSLCVLRILCTVEILKTLLKAERYHEILTRLREVPRDNAVLDGYAREAALIATIRGGNLTEAVRLGDAFLHLSSNENQPVFLYRAAELAAIQGDTARSLTLARSLCSRFGTSIPLDNPSNLKRMACTTRLLACLHAEEAGEAAARGLEAATAIDDVLLRVDFLSVIRQSATAPASLESNVEMERLRRESLYGAARTAENATQSEGGRIIDALTGRLLRLSRHNGLPVNGIRASPAW